MLPGQTSTTGAGAATGRRATVLEIRPGESRRPSPAFQERERQLQAMLDRAKARGEPTPTLPELLELVVAPLYFYALFTAPVPATETARFVDRLLEVANRRTNPAAVTTRSTPPTALRAHLGGELVVAQRDAERVGGVAE